MKRESAFVFACAFSAWAVFAPTAANAAPTYTVNSTLDQVDDNPGNGICHTVAGKCTLRAAIMEANRMTTGSQLLSIDVPPGTYTLTIAPNGSNGDDSGALKLTAVGLPITISISGAGADNTIIDANHIDSVLAVAHSRTATLRGVTLRNGAAPLAYGGGIVNQGVLSLSNCVIDHNTAQSGGGIYSDERLSLTGVTLSDNEAMSLGGGIFSSGYLGMSESILNANQAVSGAGMSVRLTAPETVIVDKSQFTNNAASMYGGAIYTDNAMLLTLDHSTLSGNHAAGGGGVYIYAGATLDMQRSTLSGNTASLGGGIFNAAGTLYASNSTVGANSATGDGGGIFNQGIGNVYNSTIVFNEADTADDGSSGAGIYNQGSNAFNVRNSIIAGNVVQADHAYEDCYGPLNTYGRNRFSNSINADVINCVPTQMDAGSYSAIGSFSELGPLQNNGGSTQTYALVPPSSMIDGVPGNVNCYDQNGTLFYDQRDSIRFGWGVCDIGAYEYDELIFRDGFDPLPF